MVETAAGGPLLPTRKLFGIPIAAATMRDALDAVALAIERRQQLQIGVVNAAKVVNMTRDPALRDDVLASDVIFADGMAVVWASRLLGRALPERVAGIDLMTGILERGRERGWRIYCLGATAEVLERAVAEMRSRYGATVAGCHDGYFAAAEEQAVAEDVARSRADVLFVAMTSPKKERFLARYSETMAVPVCHGVGGSFDVLAGKVQRAPALWQRLGLEWLYRVLQEPGRLWRRYLVTNALFCVAVAREWARLRWRSRTQAEGLQPGAPPDEP